jgi:iron complex outermembrane receptor protein
MPRFFAPLLLFIVATIAAPGAFAGEGTIEGRVVTSAGKPALDVRIVLLELNRSQYVDDDGRYSFAGVPHGSYHLQAISPQFGSTVAEVTLSGANAEQDLMLGQSRHRERVVVTATRSGRGSAEVIQPVKVLDRNDLIATMQPTLGDTLAQEPGIRSSSYGAGAGRPIVRGQSAGRVRVLEGGLDAGDASTTSADHAVAIEPLGIEKVEILRGPSTLLYGGEAVGGVVNVIDGRIPEHRASKPVSGTIGLSLGTVSDDRNGSASVNGGRGSFAWYADAFKRESDDYDAPDAEAVTNSSVESDGGSLGVSWVGDEAFLGVATKAFDTNYGIPGADEPIRINLEQNRYDLRAGFDYTTGPVTGARFNLGVTDYVHREIEDGATGTIFKTRGAESRVEMTYGRGPKWSGVAGVHVRERDVVAIGDEAFLPPNETDQYAVFVVQEYDMTGPLRWEFGLRGEHTELSTPNPATDREFDSLSGSGGFAWIGDGGIAVGVSLSSSSRAPSVEELYSFGEHLATLSFETGDPTLNEETALGLDLSLRKRYGKTSGEINLFRYDYEDYIYEFDTGATEPPSDPQGLPVFLFTQEDAEFVGFELSGLVELKHTDVIDLDLEFVGDYVRAEFDGGTAVPRIPPLSLGAGVVFNGPHWHGAARVRWYDDQTRLAPSETATDGYTTVNAAVGYRLARNDLVHDFVLRLDNLTDATIRPHTSRLKDVAVLPGRNVGMTYRLVF